MQLKYSDVFVAIATDNIQLLVDFYSRLLQQQPAIYRPDIYAEFQLDLNRLRIAIFLPKLERQAEFKPARSSMSLCLEVEQLDRAIAYIADLGYPPPGEIIESSHGREIYAYDPVGNRLILHQSATK